MNNPRNIKKSSGEDGVALIVALGIFALIVALGLNYATQSIINRDLSRNIEDTTRARGLLEAAKSRVIAKVNNAILNADSTIPLYSNQSHDKVDSTKLSSSIAGIDYGGDKKTKWIYVSSGDNTIGRFAYSICNPGSNVDSVSNINYRGIGRLNINNIIPVNPDRKGIKINEINIENADAKLNVNTILHDSPWLDFEYPKLFSDTHLGISSDTNKLRRKLTVTSFKQTDKEAYRKDGDLYHRFNLSRSDWDSVTVDSIVEGDSVTIDASYADNTDTITIPWLKNWLKEYDITGTGESSRKRQIIANLIDYCDTDNIPTAIPSTDTAYFGSPIYVGKEKVPSINEVHMELEAFVDPKPGHTTALIEIKYLKIELYNMYGIDKTSDYTIELKPIKCQFELGTDTTFKDKNTNNTIKETYTIDWSNKDYATKEIIGPGDDFTATVDYQEDEMKNFRITQLLLILLDNNSNVLNYSFIERIEDPILKTLIKNKEKFWVAYQANDPRQNLFYTNWDVDTTVNKDKTHKTLGAKNTTYNPPPNPDTHIANTKMDTPRGLGHIHRGKPWQTLNLTKFNSKAGGGQNVDSGDANILNEVKFTSKTTADSGKFNLNNPIDPIEDPTSNKLNPLTALFTGINYGNDTINKEDARHLAYGLQKDIMSDDHQNLDNNNSLKSRAEIVGANSEFRNQLTSITSIQSEQEEIVCKFINLTKAGQPNDWNDDDNYLNKNKLTFLLITQTIKDIGGKGAIIPGVNKTINGNPILSTQKALLIIEKNEKDEWITVGFKYL